MNPHAPLFGLRYFTRPSSRGPTAYVTCENMSTTPAAFGGSTTFTVKHRVMISQSDSIRSRNWIFDAAIFVFLFGNLAVRMFGIAASSLPNGYSWNSKKYSKAPTDQT